MTKRNRKTRQEMLEVYQAKVAKLEAQIAGSFEDDTGGAIIKQLKKRLRKTQTALRAATVTIDGITGKDGKGWTRAPIADKIETTRKRLLSQIETQERAENFAAKLPFDVERLKALIELAEAGEEVEMPSDLTRFGKDAERSDEEHEAAAIANAETSD